MSALSNLAGMYRPIERDEWLEGITWQPIPVHTLPVKDDPVIIRFHCVQTLHMSLSFLSYEGRGGSILSNSSGYFEQGNASIGQGQRTRGRE
jgi:hypothetical protein